ncbi:MAG TPA: hemerythrin [Comamonas sp.]
MRSAFAAHAQSHFHLEDEWMRSISFPPRVCHIGEQAALLESVEEVTELVAKQGWRLAGARSGARTVGLVPWAYDYQDCALVAWVTKKSMSGKPIVLRCNVTGQ